MRHGRTSKYDNSPYSVETQKTIEKDGLLPGYAAQELAEGNDAEAFLARLQAPARRRPRILAAAAELARLNHGYKGE